MAEESFEQTEIPIESIIVDYAFNIQPERSSDPVLIKNMMEGIAENGLLQNLVVHAVLEKLKKPDEFGNLFATRYYLIAGFVRFEAIKRLGWKKVPVTIKRNLDELGALTVNGDENSRRAQVHPFYWAKRFKFLRDKHGLTNDQIGKRHGYTASYVSNLITTYDRFPEDIREKAFKNSIVGEVPPPIAWCFSVRNKTEDEIREAYEAKYGEGRNAALQKEADEGDPEVRPEVQKRPRMRNRDDMLRFRRFQLEENAGTLLNLKGFDGEAAKLTRRDRIMLKATLDWILDAKKPFPFKIPTKVPVVKPLTDDAEVE